MGPNQPSVGRVVHYYATADQQSPFAATVAFVHNATCINIGFLTHNGEAKSQTSVCYSDTGSGWRWPPRV
ncbi:MAG TPA: hypothetical protein VGJ91_05050 [Polyangiaceae bacterium]|jgi:hypothetical protein